MLIKGISLEEWKKWIENELTPPLVVGNETKYVLEAFLELINQVRNGSN